MEAGQVSTLQALWPKFLLFLMLSSIGSASVPAWIVTAVPASFSHVAPANLPRAWEWEVSTEDGLPASIWSCSLGAGQLICSVRTPDSESGAFTSGLVALDAASGAVRWRTSLHQESYPPPEIALFGESLVLVRIGEQLAALRLADGVQLWEKPVHEARIVAVPGGIIIEQMGQFKLLDPYSGAERCQQRLSAWENEVFPFDGDILVVNRFPGIITRLKAEDLSVVWRKGVEDLRSAASVASELWLSVQKPMEEGTRWYSVQPDGELRPIAQLQGWEASLVWAREDYQLWKKKEENLLCRWQPQSQSWAWCRELPAADWIVAYDPAARQVALAASDEENDTFLIFNSNGDVTFRGSGVPAAEALYAFQGKWIWQQSHRVCLTGIPTAVATAIPDPGVQATRLLEQAAQIPPFSPLAVPRVGKLIKALLALGPEAKPALKSWISNSRTWTFLGAKKQAFPHIQARRVSSSDAVSFVAAASVLVKWGDQDATSMLIRWLQDGFTREAYTGPWLVDLATAAVRSIGCDASSVGPLVQLVETENIPCEIRFSAFAALAQFGSPEALQALQRFLHRPTRTADSRWPQAQPADPWFLENGTEWRYKWNSREFVLYEDRYGDLAPGLWLAVVEQNRIISSWFTGIPSFQEASQVAFVPSPGGFRIVLRRKAYGGEAAAETPENVIASVSWEEIQRDQDGDGLTDLLETQLGLAKNRVDTDQDGIEDALDWCPNCGQPPTGPEDEAAKALLYQVACVFDTSTDSLTPQRVTWVRPLEFAHPWRPVFVLVKGAQELEQLRAGPVDIDLMDAIWIHPINPKEPPRGWPAELLPQPGQVALELETGFLWVAALLEQKSDGAWYVVRFRAAGRC